jgi:hypothetical protein
MKVLIFIEVGPGDSGVRSKLIIRDVEISCDFVKDLAGNVQESPRQPLEEHGRGEAGAEESHLSER